MRGRSRREPLAAPPSGWWTQELMLAGAGSEASESSWDATITAGPAAFADSREHPDVNAARRHAHEWPLGRDTLQLDLQMAIVRSRISCSSQRLDRRFTWALRRQSDHPCLSDPVGRTFDNSHGASPIVNCVAIPSSRRRRSSNLLRKAALSVSAISELRSLSTERKTEESSSAASHPRCTSPGGSLPPSGNPASGSL